MPIPAIDDDDPLSAEGCQTALTEQILPSDDVFFDDTAELQPPIADKLEAVALTLRQCPEALVQISGHIDATADATVGQELTQARAETVLDYLELRGVSSERIIAVGYGADLPIADNTSEDGARHQSPN